MHGMAWPSLSRSLSLLVNVLMPTDYPSGASVQQPQSPPTVQTPVDVHPQSPKDMSNEQLALWLRNHPGLSGADYEEDIRKLIGT